jgi:PAS domain S-box-containing protein
MELASAREGTRGRILLVDDTPSTLLLLVGLLTERGYVVNPAEEGALALRFTESVLPDLILLDVRMPGMDGYQVCAKLKEDPRTRDIPVIFLSSVDQVLDKVRAFRCGAVDYVAKPCEPEEVLARIETQLALRRLRENLETAVRERTADLIRTNTRLQEEIAERKSVEQALRASERRFAIAFQASPVPLSIAASEDGRFLMVNHEFADVTGYSPEELIGRTARDLGLWSDVESFDRLFAELQARGRVRHVEGVVKTKTGESRSMVLNADIIDLDGRECCLLVAFDITDRKRAEQQLRKSSEEISQLYNNAPCGYHSLDANGLVLRVNDTELTWLGYRREELVQTVHMADLLTPHSRDTFLEGFARVKERRRLQDLEVDMLRKDGSVMPVLMHLTVPENGDGRTVVNANLFDITERKKLEQQFRQAQKMEAVGRLAGGVAHDFNNLLTVILGNSELALDDLNHSDPLHSQIDDIRQAAVSASSLTRQLLAFSRKQILQPRIVDLNNQIRDLERMLRRLIGEDIELCTVLHPDVGKFRADPGQIEQVILNLVVNARDAMPEGGSLTIETENAILTSDSEDQVPLPPGEYVVFSVTDTGEGISPEVRAHLFEPFFTSKQKGKGTGLGLSTAYGIVQQSGGAILVRSEPGCGASFRIFLPRVEGPAETTIPLPFSSRQRGSGTILLVEDDEMVRKLAALVLSAAGYRVLQAAGVDEALLHCERYREEIVLILTDVVMRDSNGPEVARRAREMCPKMKTLYMSGYTADAIAPHGILDPETALLQKPFTPIELLEKVGETLQESQ